MCKCPCLCVYVCVRWRERESRCIRVCTHPTLHLLLPKASTRSQVASSGQWRAKDSLPRAALSAAPSLPPPAGEGPEPTVLPWVRMERPAARQAAGILGSRGQQVALFPASQSWSSVAANLRGPGGPRLGRGCTSSEVNKPPPTPQTHTTPRVARGWAGGHTLLRSEWSFPAPAPAHTHTAPGWPEAGECTS